MNKYLLIFVISMFFNQFTLIGQHRPKNTLDTTNYQKISKVDELLNFGYKYNKKNILLECVFSEIDNKFLPKIKEVYTNKLNQTFENSDGTPIYDKVVDRIKLQKFVGFVVIDTDKTFKYSYGLQSDILEQLNKISKNDTIILLGKVSQLQNGNEYGLKVKYVYRKIDYYDSKKTTNNEVTLNNKNKEIDSFPNNKILLFILFFLILVIILLIFKMKRK
jgi:hypothetical protein